SGRDGRERLLTLYGSMPYFKRWVQSAHPVTDTLVPDADPLEEAPSETPIWTHINSNERFHHYRLRKITQQACERSDVPTNFTLHDIRRSRVKLLAAQSGMGIPIIRELSGLGPQMIKEFIKEAEDEDFNEGITPRFPIRCPNCGAWTPQKQPCIWCGHSHQD
ncbi:MAG: hypothetical protein ABEI86_13610, partial [Halobacteriaceae archaeon]